MKPQSAAMVDRPAVSTRAAAQAAGSLQEELVAAIRGAFEVAVQIAVQEVKKLVGQTAGAGYEEIRRENESLKERLQRAEALLDCGRMKESGESPARSKLKRSATKRADQLFQPTSDDVIGDPGVGEERGCRGVKGDKPVDHSRAQQHAPPRHEQVGRGEEQGSGDELTQQAVAACLSEEERKKEVTEATFPQCVKVESQDAAGQSPHLASHPSPDEKFTLEQFVVKQEATEDDERDGSAWCLAPVKVEGFGLECISAAQSKMLEWESDPADTESQDTHTQLAQVHPPSMATSLPPTPDLPSLSSEFPFFQMAEQAPIPEVPKDIYGVHIRGSRNLGHNVNVYTCKSCSQTFHLPSLLRRHYSQCPQKLQQRCQQPVSGGKRTRLQLYPPGCSPFRCTECNREFNRMENLKTHLRIHTGERPYTCSVCSKCFRHSGALTRHFRIHTGEKPYVCGQCGKSFRNCGGLKFHQRSHREQLQKNGTPQY